MPQQRKLTHELNLSHHHRNLPVWDHQACLLRTRNQTQLQECVPRFPAVWCVCSVRVLGFDADLTPGTERRMCGFMGLTLLVRGLVKLWWHLYLDLLRRVLFLTMDISLNSLLSFVILLCLAQSSFSILFANDKKTDSRIVFKLLPLVVDIDSIIHVHVQHVGSPVIHNVEYWSALHSLFTCSMHFLSLTILPFPSGVNTIIEPLPQPSCKDRIARSVSVTSKINIHAGEKTLRLMP